MRLSTRGRYALRAMIDLCLHADEGPVLRSNIAERQEVSAHYIGQLFVKLRRAGFIESVKGPGGGYILAISADQIKVGDIIRTVEGPIALVHCVAPQQEAACHRADNCVTHLLWKRLSDKVAEVLDSVTLEDLCDQACELEEALGNRSCNPLLLG
ncbi:MAG: Rrf2 family transcriptional regulator [Anaerolineales bacterium]|nr:MAG: Rrf2 family transcriptional regulator [Anaerolineales bacterium]